MRPFKQVDHLKAFVPDGCHSDAVFLPDKTALFFYKRKQDRFLISELKASLG